MKKQIAVVAGGYSSEYEISVKSAKTVVKNLNSALFNSILVLVKKEGFFAEIQENLYPIDLNDFSFVMNKQKIKFDAAYITLHGTPGEDGKIQGYFEMIGLPYSGLNWFKSALTFNKAWCNKLLREKGFYVADSILLSENNVNADHVVNTLGLPCFVKPNDGGSSFGVTKVKQKQDLKTAIDFAFSEGKEVLIESFLEGREFTCGVTNVRGRVESLPVTEIISEGEFFDYDAKYLGKSSEVTPAELNQEDYLQIQNVSKAVYEYLDLSGTVRVDFILHKNKPYIIEVNSNPGLSEMSIIPQQAKVYGISLEELFSNDLSCKLN